MRDDFLEYEERNENNDEIDENYCDICFCELQMIGVGDFLCPKCDKEELEKLGYLND